MSSQGMQDALYRALFTIKQRSPHRRVALVTFNDEVGDVAVVVVVLIITLILVCCFFESFFFCEHLNTNISVIPSNYHVVKDCKRCLVFIMSLNSRNHNENKSLWLIQTEPGVLIRSGDAKALGILLSILLP